MGKCGGAAAGEGAVVWVRIGIGVGLVVPPAGPLGDECGEEIPIGKNEFGFFFELLESTAGGESDSFPGPCLVLASGIPCCCLRRRYPQSSCRG